MVARLVVLVKKVLVVLQLQPTIVPIALPEKSLLLVLTPVPIALPENNLLLRKKPVPIATLVNGPLMPLPKPPLVARLVVLVKKVTVVLMLKPQILVPIALPENNNPSEEKSAVPIVMLVKYRTMVTPLVSFALRVKRRVMNLKHVSIVRSEKRVTLERTVLNCVLLVQLRTTAPPRVPIVLLVQHRLKAGLQTQNLVVPIALRVKLRDRLPYAPIVLSAKRVPLELTALRRALLVKRHPMVPPPVPFVLPVQSRLQSQQMVVPIALRMHFLCFHSLHAPTAQCPRVPPSLLPGTLLPVLPLQQQLCQALLQ